MFGLFKAKMTVSAAAKIAVLRALQFPSAMQNQLAPLNFNVDATFISECMALSYAITITSIQRASFPPRDAHRLCATFTGQFSEFTARRLVGTDNRANDQTAAATLELQNFFQERYKNYGVDVSEPNLASVFLSYVGQHRPHPTTKKIVEASIHSGLTFIGDDMTKMAKTKTLE